MYGGNGEILDFGNVSKLEVSYAFNALANTAKFGHTTIDKETITGLAEFNGINQFLLPVTALKKDYNRASKYVAGVYDIEKTRQVETTNLTNDEDSVLS